MSSFFNFVINGIFKINKKLAIYYIVFYGILIGIRNRKTIIYKCIAFNDVIIAGIPEADAREVVVAGCVACNDVIAGQVEVDTVPVAVADCVACNDVIVGIPEVDAVFVVAGCVV